MKIAKFGGSSLATSEQIEKVFQIVTSDAERKIIVVSAPGKRFPDDIKVTDLLIACGKHALQGKSYLKEFNLIIERYSEIAIGLGVSSIIMNEISLNIELALSGNKEHPAKFMDAVMACGEDNCARLVASYFQLKDIEAYYINPKEAGLYVSNEPGQAQVLSKSYENLFHLRERKGILIFPGFFGYSEDGEIVTFSRSGSDITGSVVANGVKAKLYENFTDVDAVYSVNPTIVKNPKEIKELTYREMRELSYAGFNVFHDEALIPAFQAGIPVNIKNTNNPLTPGTRIVKERTLSNGPLIGIASDNGFCSIYISKYLMNREIGFGRKVLQILEDFQISYEHQPSGIDDISIIIRQNQFPEEIESQIIKRIHHELNPDHVVVERDLALIMLVGEGMRHNVGTTARASKALAIANINIEMINQGSSEVSMMFGVKTCDEKKAVQVIYEEFFAKVSSN
ncbi:aspartate kinase [Gottfriedia luciferensis]|uniref:aspartate kinase n=1 Tax=Gottfriedia luciferensis TaxID=178774 RepID=UPI000B435FEB|nr:aspartate kinase [Gottfriedia luciferensis]